MVLLESIIRLKHLVQNFLPEISHHTELVNPKVKSLMKASGIEINALLRLSCMTFAGNKGSATVLQLRVALF
jgi:hypothetical protein